MRTLILITLVLFAASCQKDYTCHCEVIKDGFVIEKYEAFDYKSKGVMSPQNDKCLNYAEEQRASKTTQPNTSFGCNGFKK